MARFYRLILQSRYCFISVLVVITTLLLSCGGGSSGSKTSTSANTSPAASNPVNRPSPAATVTTPIAKSTELTNGVVNSPAPMEIPAGDLVGTLAGEFRVNESGAATFNVPIAVADGIAGVTPRITIGYSSQGGNGLLGKGWALGGLSEITRCRQTLSQDGVAKPITWTEEDRFCLNGQRLMLVTGTYGIAGSTYKTELDTFVTVTLKGASGGNPDSFEVVAKDGSVSIYGGNALAKVITAKGTLSWSISQFADNVGNAIAYSYENKLSNHHVIKQIDYAFGSSGVAAASIVFAYEARNDQSRSYIAGVEVVATQRLKTIISYNAASVVRAYTLNYDYAPARMGDYSRVVSVQECAEANTTALDKCYKPTEFTWFTPAAPEKYAKALGSIPHSGGRVTVTNQAFLDINGNGIQDYVWSDRSGEIKYALDSAVVPTDKSELLESVGKNNVPQFQPIDYNGDGRQDLLIYLPNEKKWVLYLSMRNPVGWILLRGGSRFINADIKLPFASFKDIKVGDVNSDGLADVVALDNQKSQILVFTLFNAYVTPTSVGSYKFDSGKSYAVNSIHTFSVEGADYYTKQLAAVESFADFNGDGKVDVLVKTRHEAFGTYNDPEAPRAYLIASQDSYEIFFNKDDVFESSGVLLKSGYQTNESISTIYTPDLNADGQADIVYMSNKTWSYMLNTGSGFTAAKALYQDGDKRAKKQKISFSDINHDGYTDVVWRSSEYVMTGTGDYDAATETYDNQQTEHLTIFVKYWNPAAGAFDAASVLLEGEDANLDYDYTFMDVNGDGWVDQVATSIYGKYTNALFTIKGFSSAADYTAAGIVPQGQITTIKNGLDNITQISYEPIGRSKHYVPMDDSKVTTRLVETCSTYDGMKETPPQCTTQPISTMDTTAFQQRVMNPFAGLGNAEDRVPAPALEVLGPVSIVTKVDSSAPLPANPAALSSVIYSYKYLRMQAAGRGMLGFETLATLDPQTGVTTETSYRQDWPYIGAPRQTLVKTADGKLLSKAVNEWDRRVVVVAGSKRYQPYLKQSVEQSYALNTDAAAAIVSGATLDEAGNVSVAPLQTVTTTTEMMDDDYGNIRQLTVKTEGAGDTLIKVTDNKYFNDPWKDRMGRLASTEVTSTRNGVADPVHKKVTFDYYPQGNARTENGLLKQEVVLDESSNPYLTTDYKYDSHGNKTEVRVSGEAEAGRTEIRKTVYSYDTQGRYLVSTTNDLSQVSTIVDRNPITGQPTKVSDINQVQAQVFYDAMGKEYLRIDATGAWSRSDTRYCSADTGCPAGAKFYTLTRVAGGGQSTRYQDMLGRVIRSSNIGFDGTAINVDTEYDNLGRSKRQSEAYLASETAAAWSENVYDILGRVTSVTLLDGSKASSSHSDYTTTITNDLGHSRRETRNGLGQLLNVEDQLKGTIDYSYTLAGALQTATTKAPDHPAEVVVRMCYDFLGRKIGMLDPDKGGWLADNKECSALSGKAPGWWTYSYNAFGELIAQRDAKGQVTTLSYDQLGRLIKRQDEDQTRWFYEKYLDGTSTPGSQGKLMEVVVRKNTSAITSYLASDDYTQYTYDTFGRLSDSLVLHPNDSTGFITSLKYDSIGRSYESRDALNGAVFSDSGVQTQYNAYGYAYRTVDIAPVGGGKGILSEIIRTNARGQVTDELRNNGAFVISNRYNSKTGLLESQKATSALAAALNLQSTIQDEGYGWDTIGNLKFRTNNNANVGSSINKNNSESFCYDGLNRLTSIVKNAAELNPTCATDTIKYDGLGNITYKKDVGDYHYGDMDGNAGPHAVTRITQGSTTENFTYDGNGNMVQDSQRSLSYTRYDMAKSISKNSASTSFSYGADRSRWQRVDVKGGITTTTTYLGNIERIQRSGSSDIEWKRSAGGALFTYKTNANQQLLVNGSNTAFIFNDHLGSVAVITDSSGKVTHSLSFDPWGARRDGDTWGTLTDTQRSAALTIGTGLMFSQPVTTRGFTGHEMVDDMGIIHMNGRIYDARIARFLQADPFIQAAANTQSYNRYSYVMNNPLNATDPSGFMSWHKRLWNSIRPFVAAIVAIVATYLCEGNTACGSAAWAWIGPVSGAAGAAANGGNILIGAFTGLIMAYAGGIGGTAGFFARGAAGGVASILMGGKFGHGFVSAGVGGAMGNIAGGMGGWEGFAASAVVGGSVSELTGGKFSNGAASAAFAYALSAGVRRIGAGGAQDDKVTAHEPENVSDKVTSQPWRNKVVKGPNGEFILKVTATISELNPIDIDSVQKYIQTATEAWGKEGVELTVTLVKGGTIEAIDTNITFERCGACGPIAGTNTIKAGETQGRYIRIDPNYVTGAAPAHEFGHWLGLAHQSNNTNSIMSYSNNAKVLSSDARMLKSCYFDKVCN